MSRAVFDPRPDEPYGECATCGIILHTDEEATEHRTSTMESGKSSHSTRGTNPPRPDRIQSWVDSIVGETIYDAVDELRQEVDYGNVTEDEILMALRWYSDFSNQWKRGS